MAKQDRRAFGQGEPHRVPKVSREQKRERLEAIEQLMIRGIGMTSIEKTCRTQFGMSKALVTKYAAEIRDRWADEERASRPSNKATAQRRIYRHIEKARSAENWAAVAALERLLSDIQGTKEATEVHVNVDARVTEATLNVVANLTPEERARIVAEQRRLRELAAAAVNGDVVALSQAAVPLATAT